MKFIKSAAAIISAAVIGMTILPTSFSVGAEFICETADAKSASSQVSQNVPDSRMDDPGYLKYIHFNQQNTAAAKGLAAVSGAANLVHNARFSKSTKSYGVDVSQYQYNIDWEKVKKAGIDFAIIRVGYRGWGKAGTLAEDPYFKQNIQGAKKAGIKVGVYFYTQAITAAEVKQEAKFCLDRLKGYKLELPVYYDIEAVWTGTSDVGRLDGAGLTKAQKTQNCKTFCEEIKKGGFTPGVYSYRSYLYNNIDGAALGKQYDLWLADYSSPTPYTGDYTTWQYSSSGSVSGIPARVDMNVRYGNIPKVDNSYDYLNVRCTEKTKTSITIAWDKQEDASGYRVYQKNSEGGYDHIFTTSETSCMIEDLSAETPCSFKVKPYYNGNGSEEYVAGESVMGTASPEFKTGTKNLMCTDVRAEKHSDNSIKVSWNDPNKRTTSYDVIRYNPDTKKYTVLKTVKEKSCVVENLSCGGYDILVRANYNNGDTKIKGVFSKKTQVILNTSYVDTVNVKFKGTNGSEVYALWSDSTKGVTYDVFFNDGSSKESVMIARGRKSKNIKLDDLKIGGKYRIAVRKRFTYDGKTYVCPVKRFSFTYKMQSPSKVLPVSTSSNTVARIKWAKSVGATEYKIYMYSPTKKKYVLKRRVSSSYTSCSVGGLKAGTAYRFKVQAVFGNTACKARAATWSFTKLSSPKNLRAISVGKTHTTFKWNPVKHAGGYKVYVYDSSKKLVKTVTAKTSKVRITFKRYSKYYIKVKAVRNYRTADFISDFSNRIVIWTL